MVVVTRILLNAGAKKKPSMAVAVKRISETFELNRSNFNKDSVEATSNALLVLCELFGVDAPTPRQVHDGKSLIRLQATQWQKRHAELWNLLVPSSGPAHTVQGEVIRISGRICDELHRNGGANWDRNYTEMAKAFGEHLRSGFPLPEAVLKDCDALVASLVKTKDCDIDRLAELAVLWVVENPQPQRLGKVSYSR